MKIAIVTRQRTIGVSSFCVLLSLVFAKTQARKAAVLSTKNIQTLLDLCDINETQTALKSFNLYQTLLASNAVQGEELFDYAFRLGSVDSFAFDFISDVNVKSKELLQSFKTTMNVVPADMVLVEICGDIFDEFNMSVLENVDAVLYLFECSRHSLSLLEEYKSKMKSHVVARTGYICSKYDREVVNEKRLAAAAGINERSLMQFPYNRKVMRSGFDGSLEECMDLIITGSPETLNIRPKLLEIMQFLFDSGRGQYIRGFDKWVK